MPFSPQFQGLVMIIKYSHIAALALILHCLTSFSVLAKEDEPQFSITSLQSYKKIIFDDAPHKPRIKVERPQSTNQAEIISKSPLTHLTEQDKTLTGCLSINPYSHFSIMDYIGQSARIVANHSAEDIEQISFQPHYSGLKGPNITIMRSDLERALVIKRGSANEIYHNTQFRATKGLTCNKDFQSLWDIELLHHIDLIDSKESPLYRSDLIVNNRYHFGGYFLGTVSSRYLVSDNLEKESDLRSLYRMDPVRQDVLGHAWQGFNLNRLMLSGFATPAKNLYLGGHAGYLEEAFFGLGGEFLYRPFKSSLSIGGEIWTTTKRIPYLGNVLTLDKNNKQTSALLNIWYDAPRLPLSFGVSAGRFLDGDMGYQLRTRLKPSNGWHLEAHATYSGHTDRTVNKDENTNWIFGARMTMPLGQFKGLPDNSRQTIDLRPFARDHGQRLDNAYPLYDLTDAWQAKEIQKNWNAITN